MRTHERSLAVFPASTKGCPWPAEGGQGEACLIKLLGGVGCGGGINIFWWGLGTEIGVGLLGWGVVGMVGRGGGGVWGVVVRRLVELKVGWSLGRGYWSAPRTPFS